MSAASTGSKWNLTDFHHVGLTVHDIVRSIEFYRDVLGMKLVRRRPDVTAEIVSRQTGYQDVKMSVASFEVSEGSPTLEVVQYRTHAGDPSDQATNRPGNSHLCLLVDDLRAAYNDVNQTDPIDFVERRGTRILSTDFRAGDLLVFGGFTLHGSLDNNSPHGRIRLSCDVRYQPERDPADDERYFGPDPQGSKGGGYGDMRGAQPLTEQGVSCAVAGLHCMPIC
jgi:catechol 2,3-dioxygenase-like lactoylglutathione lyase family enzyme